jgi:long-chain fatty acid transport protein
MMRRHERPMGRAGLGFAGCCLLLSAMPAMAGGFSRGEADTDLLYEDGSVSFSSSAVYVSPSRSYSSLMGSSVKEDAYSNDFWIPSAAMAAHLGPNVSCELSYTQPFGASATYSQAAQNAEYATATANSHPLPNPTSHMEFSTNEFGSTCDVKFAAGPGNLHVIGGIFLETFEYKEDTWFGSIHLKDDGQVGYRLGLAYDIPEYAARVQVMYRSAVDHSGDGTFTPTQLAIDNGITETLPASGAGTLPQSLKLYAQTGVAPGWLVYGSVAWTDWSVLPNFQYDISGLGVSNKVFNYKDGYTVQLGVGHEFTDALSGTVNVTWDQGVGTGADITTDTWTLGLGGEYKSKVGTFGLGVAVSYLTAGSQTVSSGATYDAKADEDWAVAVGMSYKVSF